MVIGCWRLAVVARPKPLTWAVFIEVAQLVVLKLWRQLPDIDHRF
jgi:hypothetical protein